MSVPGGGPLQRAFLGCGVAGTGAVPLVGLITNNLMGAPLWHRGDAAANTKRRHFVELADEAATGTSGRVPVVVRWAVSGVVASVGCQSGRHRRWSHGAPLSLEEEGPGVGSLPERAPHARG